MTVQDIAQSVSVATRLRSDGKEDVLQLSNTLWHAWHSLAQLHDINAGKPRRAPRDTQADNNYLARRAERRSGSSSGKIYLCADYRCAERHRLFGLAGVFTHMCVLPVHPQCFLTCFV